MNPLKLQRIVEVDVVYQEKYPDNYAGVVTYGSAYWYPHPIEILGYYGRFYDRNSYTYKDTNRRQCYNCHKFMKKEWKDWLCQNCQDQR